MKKKIIIVKPHVKTRGRREIKTENKRIENKVSRSNGVLKGIHYRRNE